MRNLSLQGERHFCLALSEERTRNAENECSLSTAHGLVDLCHVYSDTGDATSLSSQVVLTSHGHLLRTDERGSVLWTLDLNQVVRIKGSGNDDDASGSSTGSSLGWFSVNFVDPDLVCLSSSGAIVSVEPETGRGELVGEFDNGLDAGAWSPDGEVLALVTRAWQDEGETVLKSTLLAMNAQWEVLAEVDLENHLSSQTNDDDFDVSIGWRPDGSLFAVSSVDAADSQRRIRMFTRDSLALHAIGRAEDGSGKLVPNLQSTPIAWASPGCSQTLAAVQRKGKKTTLVVFFEPNGLRHREIVLRDDPASIVTGLDWNVESDLLAVALRCASCDKVQLWHRSNYHWYLKREFLFDDKVAKVQFHAENPCILNVLFSSRVDWREYRVRWDWSTVYTDAEEGSTIAFAVDGQALKSTPLHKALVPPPMYAAELALDANVSEVVFARKSASSFIAIAVLSDGRMAVIGGRGGGPSKTVARYDVPICVATVEWATVGVDPRCLRNFVLIDEAPNAVRLVAVLPAFRGELGERLVEISLSMDGEHGSAHATITKTTALEGTVLTMVPWLDSDNGLLIQLDDGSLLEYNDEAVADSYAEALMEPCPWMAALADARKYDDDSHPQRRRLVVGLSSRSRLYCHDLLIADSASSFVLSVAQGYLCYVSADSRCQLFFLPLVELHNFDPLMGSDENQVRQGQDPRHVERGSRLVAVMPTQPTAVLQLPRGNLEGVYPRALVLKFAVDKIQLQEYRAALEMMRRQKLDLNLIIDLDPVTFLDEARARLFIEQIANIDHLNLFISSLQNYDCTASRFRTPPWWKPVPSSANGAWFDFGVKINVVCKVLRTLMLEAQNKGAVKSDHFLLPILSTFAKEVPPNLEDALRLIRADALSKQPSSSKKPLLFTDHAQSAIQYLAFLADYELLFHTALGMYDFDVARAVARNSQMDPKVYLPLLKRYRELPLYFSRYEVDLRLERFESALRNLHRSAVAGETAVGEVSGNHFTACLELIQRHSLYKVGLELFALEHEQAAIMQALGEHLLAEKRPSAALSVFLAFEPVDFEHSKEAARACRDWRAFFDLLEQESEEEGESNEAASSKRNLLAHEMANDLIADSSGHFDRRRILADAARLLLDYGSDVTAAVDALIQAELWSEGRRIAKQYGRDDLIRRCLESASAYALTVMSDLEERGENFCKTNDRYAEVVKIRKAVMISEGHVQEDDHDEQGSLFSVASDMSNLSKASTGSTSTVSSVISARSVSSFCLSGADAKNKHRSKYNQIGAHSKGAKKKKKGKGRTKALPGSELELQGLVQTLRSSCVDENYKLSIGETVRFLVRCRRLDLARELYDAYSRLQSTINDSQSMRIANYAKEILDEKKRLAKEGGSGERQPVHDVEKEVDSLRCEPLSEELSDVFSLLPV